MTKDKYTIEQIEKLPKLLEYCARLLNSATASKDLIGPPADTYPYEVAAVLRQIAELQRPAFKTAIGDVVALDTYTIEKIEAGFKAIAPEFDDVPTFNGLRDYLQRPAWVPADGEMYVYPTKTGGIDIWEHTEGDDIRPGAHPQSLTMHGPAVKALREYVKQQTQIGSHCQILSSQALKAFDGVVK